MSRGGRGRGGGGERYSNPCLTMHQPWASLLVYGIKRIEGRSWPAPLSGRLWIHAASKVPDIDTIKAMEEFYREIYAVNGITDIKFPEHYPVSRLLGCVDVVGCVKSEELVCWEAVPESVRLEGLTNFCWLCESPQKLPVPFEMRGYQRVYNLEKRIFEAAVRALRPVEGPQPVKFPLPEPQDPFSLKPGSLLSNFSGSEASALEKSPSIIVAIAGAQSAATQFSKKDLHQCSGETQYEIQKHDSAGTRQNIANGEDKRVSGLQNARQQREHQSSKYVDQPTYAENGENSGRQDQNVGRGRLQPGAPSLKLFAAAMAGLKLN